MAVTVTARGTNTHNSSATTFTLSPSGSLAAGSMAVLVVAADNAHTGGTAFTSWTVTDDQANLWTRRVTPLYDPGLVNEGVTGATFTTDMAGGTLTSASVITVHFDTATTAKAWALWEVIPDSASKVISYVAGNVNTGSATTTPTVTTASITTGDVVIGGLYNEYGTAQTITGDGDATNGSWSAQQSSKVGTTGTGMSVSSQAKVVTGTATQTYNPTLGTSSDVILSWIQLRQIPFLTVGAVDQSAFILHESMTLRLNTFDFSLKNPATVPANGDTVTLGGPPAWSGTVVSVETVDYTVGYKRVNITASNADEGVASAGPFGLSDAPNNTTTFGYRDMSVRVQTNIDDATETITGSCTIFRAGLWPAMTFELTSANRGYSAQSFSVRDVTVTWPKKSAPVFRVDFGDPIVTMSVWVASQAANIPDGSIDGTKITDLSISTPKLAANAVTAEKIAANTITADEIATTLLYDGSIQFTGGQVLQGDVAPYLKLTATGSVGFMVQAAAGQICAIQLQQGTEQVSRLALEGDSTGTLSPSLSLGPGGSSGRDVYLYRPAAHTLSLLTESADGRLLLRIGHSSFPASPATNDLFYRTDFGMWFYYDGTRWVTTQLFNSAFLYEGTAPAAATFTTRAFLQSYASASNLWLVGAETSFFVVGGTALSGSHKWVGVLSPGSATIADISSGASDTWRTATHALGSLNGTNISTGVTWTKTGSPGNLYAYTILTYRIVAT